MALQPAIFALNIPSRAFQLKLPASWRIPLPLFGTSALSIPLLGHLPRPSSILQDIWEGILRAVPKKKTSKSRTRSRQMAGKALKDVMAIVKCPSCGRPKRSHYLCPYCVYAIQLYWKEAWRALGVSEAVAKTVSTTDIQTTNHEGEEQRKVV